MSRPAALATGPEGTVAEPRYARVLALRVGSAVAVALLAGLVVAGSLTRQRSPAEPIAVASEMLVAFVIVLAGQLGWAKRPESRIGPLLVIASLLYLAKDLFYTDWPLAFTVGLLLADTEAAVFAHAMITFPTGRTSSRTERILVLVVYAYFLAVGPLRAMFVDTTDPWCHGCPGNLALVADAPRVSDVLSASLVVFSWPLIAAFLLVLWRKWHRGSSAARRALAPVLFGAALVTLPAFLPLGPVRLWFNQSAILVFSLGILFGLLRTRLARSAVGDLVVELGRGAHPPAGLREALARRLGDPSLEIAYHVPERGGYVDAAGRSIELPPDGSGRAVTMLEADGKPIAGLIHDEFLRHDPEIVEAVAAAARLAIVNEGLRAEVRAKLEEVRASRARIVQAGDTERRRVERNLHDGAQQRLVTLSLALGLIRDRIDEEADPDLAAQVDTVSKELREAIEEVRELARGIHPAILTEEGLLAAVESLAERSPVPISLDLSPIDRLPQPVEATAYFVVAEALTNVAKYAPASRVSVRLTRNDPALEVEVADDGPGGAHPEVGSGLRGLSDRVAAMGGELFLESPPGAGTRVRAEIPCDGR